MACAVIPGIMPLAPLMPPLITAGFVMTLISKNVAAPTALFSLFWYVATYLGFFFEASVIGRTDFLGWPIGFFLVGSAMGSVVSQVGNYPRLFDYFDGLRSTQDASSRAFDRRFTVWEGLVLSLSFFSIYLGSLLVHGKFSDGCLLIPANVATGSGWVLILVGLVGLAAVILVTIFNNASSNIERLRMWKYVIPTTVLVGGQILGNNLSYSLSGIHTWYGAVGLVPVIVVWVCMYWWITAVDFSSEMQIRAAIKANGDELNVNTILMQTALDGFKIPQRAIVFVVTGSLYNVFVVLAVWAAAVLSANSLSVTFLTALIFTAISAVIVIIVNAVTTYYYSGVKAI